MYVIRPLRARRYIACSHRRKMKWVGCAGLRLVVLLLLLSYSGAEGRGVFNRSTLHRVVILPNQLQSARIARNNLASCVDLVKVEGVWFDYERL